MSKRKPVSNEISNENEKRHKVTHDTDLLSYVPSTSDIMSTHISLSNYLKDLGMEERDWDGTYYPSDMAHKICRRFFWR